MWGIPFLTVYHKETHTCSFKPAVAWNDELLADAIQEKADPGSAGTVRRKLMKAIQWEASIEDVAQLAKKQSNNPRMKHVRQGMVSFQHPETQSLENTYEKYAIYFKKFQKVSNRPSWVFKSFRQLGELNIRIYCSSEDSPLADEAFYSDETPS